MWIKSIARLDDSLRVHTTCKSTSWMNKAVLASKPLASRIPPATANDNAASSSAKFTCRFVYKLTDLQRELFSENEGCTNCRKIFAGHDFASCPQGDSPLLLSDYKPTLTCEYVASVHAARKAGGKGKGKLTTIGAIFEDSSDEDTMHIGSEYILPHHLTWSCTVSAPSIAPLPVVVMIDHGAPPALISTSFAAQLGLAPRKLNKLLHISAAFPNDDKHATSALVLDSYVKLSVQSPCAQWKSHAQIFIICPNLRAQLILSLDFLSNNNIVIDAKDRSVIDKASGFDLLNPPDPKLARVPVIITPFERRNAEAKAIKKGQAIM
ncbi:hypothetical protein Hypma_009385 [Hypsizygus marmoreus]|uniref:Uncharacterized protein n=1 Tax=Hypsizygus marmoreus TaxID=39966 RepID=A0A369JPN3_HYPMA|nr:hypothetical protein Hypma_009385 [Hypsizygus marmoreus]